MPAKCVTENDAGIQQKVIVAVSDIIKNSYPKDVISL